MSQKKYQETGEKYSGGSLFKYRFFVLLCTLFLLLLTAPIVRILAPRIHIRFVITLIFMTLLLSATFAVSKSRRTEIIAIVLLIPAFFLQALYLFYDNVDTEIARQILSILFLLFVTTTILKHLFDIQRVTFDTICASLCVYMLMGIFWAHVYTLTETMGIGTFAYPLAQNDPDALWAFGKENPINVYYYSFVTLTTLGYGDIIPTSPLTQAFAVLEALIGQIYLIVLVARLVGLHIVHSRD